MQYELIQLPATNSNYNCPKELLFLNFSSLYSILENQTSLYLLLGKLRGWAALKGVFAHPPVILVAPLWKIASFSTSFFNCGYYSWMEWTQSSCTNAKHSSKATPEYRDREYQAGSKDCFRPFGHSTRVRDDTQPIMHSSPQSFSRLLFLSPVHSIWYIDLRFLISFTCRILKREIICYFHSTKGSKACERGPSVLC